MTRPVRLVWRALCRLRERVSLRWPDGAAVDLREPDMLTVNDVRRLEDQQAMGET